MLFRLLEVVSLLVLIPGFAFSQPQEVRTGVYLMNLHDMNMDEHSFYADFYIWFKWKGPLDPTNIEFVNSIEKWSLAQSGFDNDSTVTLRDGTKYRILRVEGRFFHAYSLRRFPLDCHALDIQIENPEYPADSLVYVPDTALVRSTLNLVSWQNGGCRLASTLHDYGTDFGNPEENARVYSNITFFIDLSRPLSYFLLKMLLPLFVVMMVSIGALIAHPSYVDTRSALPIGGLLTAVFLQQTYSNALPDTGYMVLMDKIYLLSYVLISLVLLHVLISGNLLLRKKSATTKQIIRFERRLAILYLSIFAIGVALFCL